MSEAYNRALERLNRDFPGKRQALTLRELCEVIPVKIRTLQSQKADARLGFPVVEVGGQVLVTKETVAKLIVGLNPYEEVATDNKEENTPVTKPLAKPRHGRVK